MIGSTDRIPKQRGFVNVKNLPKGPRGFALCRECGNETPGKRRTFCGPDCVHEWKCRTDPGYQAIQIEKRDHGICAICRTDTLKNLKELKNLADSAESKDSNGMRRLAWFACLLGYWTIQKQRQRPFDSWLQLQLNRRPFDVDHVVPVVEGGGGCGLENLRTLCICCHKKETKALAKRRAKKI